MTKAKSDIYQEITDTIIVQLETAGSDWIKNWSSSNIGGNININSKNSYRGINILLLNHSRYSNSFESSTWGTFKQWQDKGGKVTKGSKGTTCVFFKQFETQDKVTGDDIKIPVLRKFSLFNHDQIEGVDLPVVSPVSLNEKIETAEDILKSSGAKIITGEPCFIPSQDLIRMPSLNDFSDSEGYYCTAFHELTHWSGHKSRLDRDLNNRFGSEAYACEELVAELGAAFIASQIGLSVTPRADHAKYLNNWLKVLKNDKKAIFTAASKAQQAADYLITMKDQEVTIAA